MFDTWTLRVLVAYARDELRLRRLVLRIDPGNVASVRVARRAGFTVTDEPPVPQTVPGGRANLRTWELR